MPMMNALRMVWIISRHYSDDAKMGGLFARIAHVLGDRIEQCISPAAVFTAGAAEALPLLDAGAAVLAEWRESYLRVRERIEASRQHARWEFPKAMLFERTSHAADVLRELRAMIDIVDEFAKFLGPELKAVTGDTEVCPCWAVTSRRLGRASASRSHAATKHAAFAVGAQQPILNARRQCAPSSPRHCSVCHDVRPNAEMAPDHHACRQSTP